jgi:predicted transcriptional regulator
MHSPMRPRDYAPVIISVVREAPGITAREIQARGGLFGSEVSSALRNLLDQRRIEPRGAGFQVREKQKQQPKRQTWRGRLAWLIFGM